MAPLLSEWGEVTGVDFSPYGIDFANEYRQLERSEVWLQPIENWLTPRQLASLLKQSGFNIVCHHGCIMEKKWQLGPNIVRCLQHDRTIAIFNTLRLNKLHSRLILPYSLFQFVAARML
jgi:hypothetical protein